MTSNVKNFIQKNSHYFNNNDIDKFFKIAADDLKTSEILELETMLIKANIEFTPEQIFKPFSGFKLFNINDEGTWRYQFLDFLEQMFSKKIHFPQPVNVENFLEIVKNRPNLTPHTNVPSTLKQIDRVEIEPCIFIKDGRVQKILVLTFASRNHPGTITFSYDDINNYESNVLGKEIFRVIPHIGVGYNSKEIAQCIDDVVQELLNAIAN